MKAALAEKPRIIVVKEVPKPNLENEYEILVNVCKASICRHLNYELCQRLRHL